MEPYFLEDCSKWIIPNTGWTIHGYSRAGTRTGFAIFSLKLYFDAGLCTRRTPESLLLTHSHSDHSFQVPCLAMGRRHVCKVYCPTAVVQPLRLLCKASQSLNDCVALVEDDVVRCKGIEPGDTIQHKNITIKVVKCYHTVPCVGFQLIEHKKVLKDEYRHLKSNDIRELKHKGVVVSRIKPIIRFTFLGDTTIDVFDHLDMHGVIMVECTILDDLLSPEETYERGHIHWYQLEPVVKKHLHMTFVIIHVSTRYDKNFIQEFQQRVPQNVYFWKNM